MADVTKGWHAVFDKGSKQAQERLKKAHGNKPEFQAFLKSRGAEGGERSVKQASTSLKKTTDAKITAQKIADLRFKKALQASSERVREMGRRRREGGEGLGGGLETARDVVAHVKKYGSIKAGRLGEGFDPEPADIAAELVKKHGKGKVTSKHLDAYEADRDTQKGLDREEIMKHVNKLSEETVNEVSKAEAEKVLGGAVKEKPKMSPGKQPAGYRYVRGLARKAMKAGLKKEEVEVIETPEVVVEQDDSMEKKEMAQTQLHFIKYAAEEILEFIDMGGEVEEWYQNKLSKVQSEVESLHSYVEGEKRRTGMVKEEEEQIDEKAPPGAKYERMVKHIKKGYAKGGLTPKEKSIAYATAWKAYKANEEIEQTDEATADWKRAFGAVATKNLAKDIGSMRTKTSRLRFVGMKPAVDTTPKVTAAVTKRGTYAEEVEQIDEISNTTLKSYLKKKHTQVMQDLGAAKSERERNKIRSAHDRETKPAELRVAAYDSGRRGDLTYHGVGDDPHGPLDKILKKRYKEGQKNMTKSGQAFQKRLAKQGIVSDEFVAEAEGKVAVTPQEKTLAAKHGDKTKITYGDVIKARIQSAKEKALKGKE